MTPKQQKEFAAAMVCMGVTFVLSIISGIVFTSMLVSMLEAATK
jgi:hypothetical protein